MTLTVGTLHLDFNASSLSLAAPFFGDLYAVRRGNRRPLGWWRETNGTTRFTWGRRT